MSYYDENRPTVFFAALAAIFALIAVMSKLGWEDIVCNHAVEAQENERVVKYCPKDIVGDYFLEEK